METTDRLYPAYSTGLGAAYRGHSLRLLTSLADGSVNLVMTSPPFALQRQKTYGNLDELAYVDWIVDFAKEIFRVLPDDGSFVIDMGGAYRKGMPSRSLYQFRALIRMCDEVGFHLAQDFYWNNPSKLPSPIEWVNKRKIRAKDSVNNVWWLSKTEWPKANVSKVLSPYSDRMRKLLKDPAAFYMPKVRPSGHDIGAGFSKDNGGAIPSSLLSLPNTESNGRYDAACKLVGTERHPARFPAGLPQFFIKFLTEPGDMVFDIFGGSNVTGQVAEAEGRRWMSCDLSLEYVAASAFRFLPPGAHDSLIRQVHADIMAGKEVHLSNPARQSDLLAVE